eukprot:5034246-Pleurochrysis_carterae.AAC.1
MGKATRQLGVAEPPSPPGLTHCRRLARGWCTGVAREPACMSRVRTRLGAGPSTRLESHLYVMSTS